MESERRSVRWGLLFDSLTVVMLVVVTRVSTLVHRYSIEYMSADPHRSRFMSYLSRFTFFMLVLVTADNRVQMFVGWEGVGLCSYLLINFWFTRIQANKAAIKAMLVNRVGDFGLALGILAVYREFHAVDYATIFALAPLAVGSQRDRRGWHVDSLTVMGLLLFVGAVGKSAQLGLHTWLPDAMEGPTPVSALIHAATMVTAGVFLRARCSPLLEYAPTVLAVITVRGAMTAFFAGTVGLVQNDLKRVIAYSTCSQLGYMVFACGRSAYSVGVFHLANHALFKALLFLSAGSVIHAMADEQDMRRMGGLVRILPRTYAMIFIGSVALMGFPFLTGFYSKDVILEIAYGSYTLPGHRAHWLGTRAAFCTAFYSMRLLYLTFLAEPAGHKSVREGAHDAPRRMALPLLILSVGSIFVGWLTKDRRIGLGTSFWGSALFTHPDHLVQMEAEFIPHSIKRVPVIFSIVGGRRARRIYSRYAHALYDLKISAWGRPLYVFRNRKWFFDKVYNEFINQAVRHHAYHTTYKRVDRGIIERLGPEGLSRSLGLRATVVQDFHNGVVSRYLMRLVGGVSVLRVLALWPDRTTRSTWRDPRRALLLVGYSWMISGGPGWMGAFQDQD
jgi:NADH-ubiquinone oxidoreductase chain 5